MHFNNNIKALNIIEKKFAKKNFKVTKNLTYLIRQPIYNKNEVKFNKFNYYIKTYNLFLIENYLIH